MIECPYKLPVSKRQDRNACDVFDVQDANGKIIIWSFTEDKAEFLVQCINGWEKMVKLIRDYKHCGKIAYEAICTGNQDASDKAIGLLDDLLEIVEQLFKEIGEG